MTDSTVFVVYSRGSSGSSTPHAVFIERKDAENAREALIKRFENSATEESALDYIHALEGSFEEQVRIDEFELQEQFDGDVENLFVSPDR